MLPHRPWLAATASLMVIAACGGNHSLDDFCALADLPAQTPADIDVLQHRVDAVMAAHKGEVTDTTGRNQRIVRAVISVQQSAQHAKFLAGASASGLASLTSDFFKDFGTGTGFTITDLPRALVELRTACHE